MYIELNAIFGNDGACKSFDETFVLEDAVIASPVRVSGRVFNRTGIVRLEATARYLLNAVCARCNAPVTGERTVPIDHTLVAHAESEESDDFIVAENMLLDLDALVSEDIFLAMPYRFLCSDSCKGLCPVCGADLNVSPCHCAKPADPRWDVLKSLT